MKAIQHILVPVDFSEVAENALSYAIQFAQEVGAKKLHMLHAYHLPSTVSFAAYPYDNPYVDEMLDIKSIEEEVRNDLQNLESRLLHHAKIPYELHMEYGYPSEVINKVVEQHNIDLVIMGSRGKNTLAKFLGTTTVDIMTQCSCPVLAIPQEARFSHIRQIIFAADYKKVKQPNAFEMLTAIARIFNAEIEVLHIDTQSKMTTEGINVGSAIERSLGNIPYHFRNVKADNVNQGIQNYIEKHKADILAMMPRQHSFLDRLWHSSKTQKMLFHTHIPLLAFHD